MSGDIIRVVLADDHAVVRTGLKTALAGARDIQIVGEASNGAEAITLAEQLTPDVVVMDLTMPVMNGLDATKAIVAKGLGTRVLMLSMHSEEEYVAEATAAGASGYVIKTDAERELVNAVRAVAHGDSYMRPPRPRPITPKLSIADPGLTERERYQMLTAREREVLRLIGQGYSAPEIGQRLSISPKTVDTYKQRIHEKLNLSHRSHYVQFALRLGLLAQT